jgi:signal transduction histidine kinase
LDTKLKVAKPWRAWICFFLAVNLLSIPLFAALAAILHSNGSLEAVKAPFVENFKDTSVFETQTARYFSLLLGLANENETVEDTQIAAAKRILNQEGNNLRYYVLNPDIGLNLGNLDEEPLYLNPGEMPGPPSGYGYFLYFDGEKITVVDHGTVVDAERLDSGYRNIISSLSNVYYYQTAEVGPGGSLSFSLPDSEKSQNLANYRVFLAINDVLAANPYGHSVYDQQQKYLIFMKWTYPVLALLGLIFLIYALIKWPEKRDYDRRLAAWSGDMWLEVKLLVSLIVLTLAVGISPIFGISPGGSDFLGWWLEATMMNISFLAGLWWFYLMILDLFYNRRAFFSHNLLNSLLKWYLKLENRASWQKSMLKRLYWLLAAEAVLALTSVLFLITSTHSGDWFILFLIAVMIAGAGIYLIYQYCLRYTQIVNDLERLFKHIESIKNGPAAAKLDIPREHDLYPVAQNLNSIQEGIMKTVADQMKSERMKIDLITNVSHDLKTPLTSIISYVDLLKKEEGLPQPARDYIGILAQKSERLKHLIQDLFDLSKASSENMAVDLEKIDLGRLIKQTLADMEEPINNSGLAFRVNIPEEPVYIISDGKKLYRVWENLISNALKYSLAGSRVYIDLIQNGRGAVATVKNTANYEMDFTEDEILQRFVRGDQSRSTEGSGLGLSIAQSFAAICGAQLSVKIDGDLFKVELAFAEFYSD